MTFNRLILGELKTQLKREKIIIIKNHQICVFDHLIHLFDKIKEVDALSKCSLVPGFPWGKAFLYSWRPLIAVIIFGASI